MSSKDFLQLDQSFFTEELTRKANLLEESALKSLSSLVSKTCAGKEWTGWVDWPSLHGFKLASEITEWKRQLGIAYDLVVVIGIGGSYLGVKAVVDLLSPQYYSKHTSNKPMVVFAGQNMSETALGELLAMMDAHNPMVTVISKTGTTTEPGVAFRVINSWMTQRFGAQESARRTVAITDSSKGALRRLATERGYKTFTVPDNVGGRYSVFTAVGLVPLVLAGFDVEEFLNGADRAFCSILKRTDDQIFRTVLDYAKCRSAAWNAGKCVEVVTYPEPRMRNLIEWFKQLFGESDGKSGKGLFPVSLECTMDLHSIGQYLQDGARTMIETFISVENPRRQDHRTTVPTTGCNLDELQYLEGIGIDDINKKAMLATRTAHSKGGVPCLELKLANLNISSIGLLLAALQTSCAVGGLMQGINPFDQPGVEAYKTNMFALLGKPISRQGVTI